MKFIAGFTLMLVGLIWFGLGCEQEQVVETMQQDGDALWEAAAMEVDLLNHAQHNSTPCAGTTPPPQADRQYCWAYATVRALRSRDPYHYCSWPTDVDIQTMNTNGFTQYSFSLTTVQAGDVVAIGSEYNHVVYVEDVQHRVSKAGIKIADANRRGTGQILRNTLAEVEAELNASAGQTWRYTCTVTSSGSCGNEPPTAPVLTSPQNGVLLSILDATFFWNSSGSGCTYEIQLNDGITTHTGTTTSLNWDGFLLSRKGVLHTWKVAAYRDTYGPIWSTSTFSFRTPFPELSIEGSSTVPSNTQIYYCAMPEQNYSEYGYKWFKNGVQVATTECTYMSFSSASTIRLEGWHGGVLRKSVTMNITIDNGGKGGLEP